jgi:hypothetical protein
MISKLFSAALFLAFSSAAFANSCPLYMSDIDEALADPGIEQRLSEEQTSEVRQLRKQGEQAHQDGDHAKSIESLGRAKEILGIS